jgi:hypothetical protein
MAGLGRTIVFIFIILKSVMNDQYIFRAFIAFIQKLIRDKI